MLSFSKHYDGYKPSLWLHFLTVYYSKTQLLATLPGCSPRTVSCEIAPVYIENLLGRWVVFDVTRFAFMWAMARRVTMGGLTTNYTN